MTPYNDILKLNSEGMSTRAIERTIGVSRKTVITVLHLAELYDLTYPLDTPMTDTQIHRLLHPKKESARLRPNIEAVIFELSMHNRNGTRERALNAHVGRITLKVPRRR